ncbi:MAG: phosphodiester glycosidase family protein [Sphingomicrobium sp.]
MRSAFLLFALLAGCGAETAAAPEPPRSACAQRLFEGSRFTVCSAKGGTIEIRTSGKDGRPYRTFAALEAALGPRASQMAFAMNAGMFDEAGHAIGLLVEDGRELHAINRRKGGGNFHLLPNGVFVVRRDGSAAVMRTTDYTPSQRIAFATKSGPMLVIAGQLHPRYEPDGQSRNIRNGVGIAPDGTALFVISEDFVSFGKFARLFRDSLKARNALYFDGSVSALWDPANARRDIGAELGPMVVVFRPAASAPGRAARATP